MRYHTTTIKEPIMLSAIIAMIMGGLDIIVKVVQRLFIMLLITFIAIFALFSGVLLFLIHLVS
jgi:hypothetical protein